MKARTMGIGVGVLLLLLGGVGACSRSTRSPSDSAGAENAVEVWTCSMHPQIRQNQPGRCPICGMDLVPLKATGESTGPGVLELSSEAEALAEIATDIVRRRPLVAALRWVGKVAVDETRQWDIAPLTGGRVEKLYANYEGVFVRAGAPLAEIYSPAVATAIRELQSVAALSGSPAAWREAARTRLRRFGLADDDIRALERSERDIETYRLRSPADGIVTRIYVREQGWIEGGQTFLQMADLARVWIWFAVYESDLELVHPGATVRFTIEARPSRRYEGRVTYVTPKLDEATRAAGARVEADNPDGSLRPGLFVRGEMEVALHSEDEMPLAVPATAPLITGRRAIVYVKVGPGRYEGREIELGRRAGDYYVVLSGLREGEMVVTRGAMKIDSTLQLLARPSMMHVEDARPFDAQEASAPEAADATQHHSAHELKSGASGAARCPVMGGPIRPDVFVDYQGQRIYFCCPGCVDVFRQSPEAYLNRLRQPHAAQEADPEANP